MAADADAAATLPSAVAAAAAASRRLRPAVATVTPFPTARALYATSASAGLPTQISLARSLRQQVLDAEAAEERQTTIFGYKRSGWAAPPASVPAPAPEAERKKLADYAGAAQALDIEHILPAVARREMRVLPRQGLPRPSSRQTRLAIEQLAASDALAAAGGAAGARDVPRAAAGLEDVPRGLGP